LLHRAVDLALEGDVVARGREYTAQVEGKSGLGGQGVRLGDRVHRAHGGEAASGPCGPIDGLVLGDDETAQAPVAEGDTLDEVGLHHGGGGILIDEGLVHGLKEGALLGTVVGDELGREDAVFDGVAGGAALSRGGAGTRRAATVTPVGGGLGGGSGLAGSCDGGHGNLLLWVAMGYERIRDCCKGVGTARRAPTRWDGGRYGIAPYRHYIRTYVLLQWAIVHNCER